MSSLTRILAVLDLLTRLRPEITPEDIARSLDVSPATSYRYVRELVAAGLLRRIGEARYALGARIIELDFQIRSSDPLLIAAGREMNILARQTGLSVTLVSVYGTRMITLHLEQGAEPLDISYGRGRPLPLLRGTPSLTLLAHLPRARQRALFEAGTRDTDAPGPAWEALLGRLRDIRRAGYGLSEGELDPQNAGIAVPVFYPDGGAAASLCAVVPRQRLPIVHLDRLVAMLREAASRISARIADARTDRPEPVAGVDPIDGADPMDGSDPMDASDRLNGAAPCDRAYPPDRAD